MNRNKTFSIPGLILTVAAGVLPWVAVFFAPVLPVIIVCAVCTVLAAAALLVTIIGGKRRNQELSDRIVQLQSVLEVEETAFDTAEDGLEQLSAVVAVQQAARAEVQRTNSLFMTEWYGKMKPLLAEADQRTGQLAKDNENYYPLRKLSHKLRGMTEEIRQGIDVGGDYTVEYDMRYVRSVSLDRLVNGMLLQAVPSIRNRNIHVERTVQRLKVQSDPVLLAQVLEELMTNAVRHTPDNGKITVSATENNGMAELTIENPGVGMSPEDLLTVFQRGTVAQGETPARPGMGLFLVRSYCHLLGHTIELRAEPGKGTKVVLRIKLTAAPKEVPAAPEEMTAESAAPEASPAETAPEAEN